MASVDGSLQLRQEAAATAVAEPRPLPKDSTLLPSELPTNWEQQWDAISIMRTSATAPVDKLGCHMLPEPGANPKLRRFQLLIALLMSPQTADDTVAQAMKKLQKLGACTPHKLLEYSDEEVAHVIANITFPKMKAPMLREAARLCLHEHDGDIPNNYKDILRIRGAGQNVAKLLMQHAWGQTVGVAVDTHLHRITNRLGWAKTSSPDQTAKILEAWLPEHRWAAMSPLFAGFGQKICTAEEPRCDRCLLRSSCPSSAPQKKADV